MHACMRTRCDMHARCLETLQAVALTTTPVSHRHCSRHVWDSAQHVQRTERPIMHTKDAACLGSHLSQQRARAHDNNSARPSAALTGAGGRVFQSLRAKGREQQRQGDDGLPAESSCMKQ